MIQNKDLTPEQILEKLDQTSQKSRLISIGFSIVLLLILSVIAFLTYNAYENLAYLKTQTDELAEKKNKLREEKDSLEKAISEARMNIASNNCQEADKILGNADNYNQSETNPKQNPNPIPASTKTPNKIAISPSPQKPISDSPATVYVQIAEKQQRDSAKKIIQNLNGSKFKFPGIELVERSVKNSQVRYFHQEDRSKADELVKQLNSLNIKASAVFTPLKSPENILEIWFANDAFPQ